MDVLLHQAKLRLGLPLVFVAVMWLVEIANLVSHGAFIRFGIQPRNWAGLWGIVFAPLLHVGIAHLIANTGPFLVLGWLVALRGPRTFLIVTGLVWVLGGAGTWLIGRPFTVVIGASGLIFGYLGFLLACGFFERSLWSVALSIVALVLYGGAIWGILPTDTAVSWEGHVCGFLAGILAGRQLSGAAPTGRALSSGRAA